MEALNRNMQLLVPTVNHSLVTSTEKAFIEANTEVMTLRELRDEHIIPVFSATNEPLISHHEFIDTVYHITKNWYQNESVLQPSIRVSHPIKGRIPEAKYKKSHELMPWEQTLYYERMMFVIEIPTIMRTMNGSTLTLTIGGVKSYSKDNLYSKRPSGDQEFQLFIGFKNKVCCNLCVSTDGLKTMCKIKSLSELAIGVEHLLQSYDYDKHLEEMQCMSELRLSESEFAKLIGKARMYRFIPDKAHKPILPVHFGDCQMGAVVKDFYQDENFNANHDGSIDLWRLFNLFTGANKSTYIDQFLERAENATCLIQEIKKHKTQEAQSWYLL